MEDKNTIKVTNDKGETIVCDILFTFDSDETGKSYIVYTDNTKDESGKVRVYASTYNPNDPKTKLEELQTDKEWKIIDTILQTLQEEINKYQAEGV